MGGTLLVTGGCETTTNHRAASPRPPAEPLAESAEARRGLDAVDPDAPAEFTTTASGLKYRIRRASDRQKPSLGSTVRVDYKGWLDDKTVFDQSYGRGATTFELGQVVKGWTEGLQHVGEGGMIELEIPPELGYGAKGSPPKIPPNATLHFLVELHDIL